MVRVLFVCLGNICRSPAAEGVFRHIAARAGFEVHIESAGTGDWHVGELPDSRMRASAKKRGYDLSSRAQQFARDHFASFDLIVVMDDSNYRNVVNLARNDDERRKVRRFAEFVTLPGVDHVPDPYYGGPEGFDHVLDILEHGSQALLNHLRDLT